MKRIPMLLLAATTVMAGEAGGRWVAAERATVSETIQVTGSLKPLRAAVLSSRVSGRVAEVLVDVGDQVVAGQELLRLEQTTFQFTATARQAELAAAQARLQAACSVIPAAAASLTTSIAEAVTAQHEQARRELLRRNGDPVSEQELERVATAAIAAAARVSINRAQIAQAQAQIAELRAAATASEAALGLARNDLVETTIRAPFAGVIARRLLDPGVVVTTMPVVELFEIQQIDQLWLEYSLPQNAAASVAPGAAIRWRIDGIAEGEAAVTTVWPAIDPTTRGQRMRTRLPADGKIRPGQLATVTVTLRTLPDTVVVPRSALRRSGDAWLATCRDGERSLRLGIVDGDRAQVLEGVKPGDEVRVP